GALGTLGTAGAPLAAGALDAAGVLDATCPLGTGKDPEAGGLGIGVPDAIPGDCFTCCVATRGCGAGISAGADAGTGDAAGVSFAPGAGGGGACALRGASPSPAQSRP